MKNDDFKLEQGIVTATKDVFSTMVMMELEDGCPVVGKGGEIQSNISSMLGLGGDVRGILAIHCPADVARGITGAFIGMEVEALNDDVKDAIGELANMIAGNLKIHLAAFDMDVKLAIPTSVIGESYHASGLFGACRIAVPFVSTDGPFWIELKYMLNG
ncbi:MAG: chemotaxis protein CheX [Desulfocapsaceae bacterium]|nr:chemotaxis protein CheX [Desulfocapsaceae bacterium]